VIRHGVVEVEVDTRVGPFGCAGGGSCNARVQRPFRNQDVADCTHPRGVRSRRTEHGCGCVTVVRGCGRGAREHSTVAAKAGRRRREGRDGRRVAAGRPARPGR